MLYKACNADQRSASRLIKTVRIESSIDKMVRSINQMEHPTDQAKFTVEVVESVEMVQVFQRYTSPEHDHKTALWETGY